MRRVIGWAIALGSAAGCGGKSSPLPSEVPTELAPDAAPGEEEPGGTGKAPVTPTKGTPETHPDKAPVAPAPGKAPPAEASPAPAKPTPAPGVPTKSPRPVPVCPPGIQQVSGTEWTFTSDLLSAWKKAPGTLGRVRKVEGGWELYGMKIRQGNFLGMRNGDVIVEINGHKLETRTQQLGAWFDLRNEEEFEVVFLRGGQRVVHRYRQAN